MKLSLTYAVLISLILTIGTLGCKKSSPVETQDPTPIPTIIPTPIPTNTPTPFPPSDTGIYWESAVVSFSNYGGSDLEVASLNLWVDGLPEATAAVTISGPGVPGSMPLTYAGPVTVSGSVYANYKTYALSYQPGTDYTLSTVTSAGTISATTSAPGGIFFAPDKSWVDWTFAGDYFSFAGVHAPTCWPGSGGCGWTLTVGSPEPLAVPPVNLLPGYTSVTSEDIYVIIKNSILVSGASGGSRFNVSQYWKDSYP